MVRQLRVTRLHSHILPLWLFTLAGLAVWTMGCPQMQTVNKADQLVPQSSDRIHCFSQIQPLTSIQRDSGLSLYHRTFQGPVAMGEFGEGCGCYVSMARSARRERRRGCG
jgi:hypothetical protein